MFSRFPLGLLAAAVTIAMGCKTEPTVEAIRDPSGSPTDTSPRASEADTRPKATASGECTDDSDCVLSTFPGCCVCCACGPIRAMPLEEESARKDACKRKDCRSCRGVDASCPACVDPVKEGMAARCIASKCTLVETKRR